MVAYIDIHPVNPQPRLVTRVIGILRSGGLIAYPTDSCYALGCALDNADGLDRIRRLRSLDSRHHFTLVCSDFSQVGHLVQVTTRPSGCYGRRLRGRTRSSCRPFAMCPAG